MLISRKQHQANLQNAQHSTGPVSPEGKAAVRCNAITFGLRARNVVLFDEDEAAYQQIFDVLESEWQPQAPTEKILLERMVVAHWLLMRADSSEAWISTATVPGPQQSALFDRVSAQRVRHERSFSTAMRELKQLQNERRARTQPECTQPEPVQPVHTEPTVTAPAHRPAPPPAYVMSSAPDAQPLSCAPTSQDTR
ncbi:MAG: hypothetical protein ABSC93_05630 [Bryobacteraceae bacterium]|jgi:hypothetical protein